MKTLKAPSRLDLKEYIRDIPNFPKKGIIFKDITPLLGNGAAFSYSIELLAKVGLKHKGGQVAIESRGFIFGSAVAQLLGVGVVPVRKKGKLPYKTLSATYTLEYGEDTLEMHVDGILPGERVLVVDDVLAHRGNRRSCFASRRPGGRLPWPWCSPSNSNFERGRERLKDFEVASLILYR